MDKIAIFSTIITNLEVSYEKEAWKSFMMFFFRRCLLFLILLLSWAPNLICQVEALYKLNESDILQAKIKLEQAENRKQAMRYSLLTVGASLTGLFLFKAWQNFGSKSQVNLEVDAEPLRLDEAVLDLQQRVLKLEKFENLDKSYLEKIKIFLITNAPLVVLQQSINQVNTIFSESNIKHLIGQTDLDTHFKRLKIAQIQFDPRAFAANINHQSDPRLCAYAKQVAANFEVMPADRLAELKVEAQVVWTSEANEIIKQMAKIIAYIRYMNKNNYSQAVLENCAQQLYLATYDFACRLEAAFAKDDVNELFDCVALLHSTFNITVNNALVFSR